MTLDENGINVLVMEDIESIRNQLAKDLNSLGYTAHFSASREEFLDIYQEVPAHAIILDNNVPYDRGGQVQRGIGARLARGLGIKKEGIRIAIHTESELNPMIERALELGVQYLKKPLSREELKHFLQD